MGLYQRHLCPASRLAATVTSFPGIIISFARCPLRAHCRVSAGRRSFLCSRYTSLSSIIIVPYCGLKQGVRTLLCTPEFPRWYPSAIFYAMLHTKDTGGYTFGRGAMHCALILPGSPGSRNALYPLPRFGFQVRFISGCSKGDFRGMPPLLCTPTPALVA